MIKTYKFIFMKLLASLQSKRVFVPKTAKSTCIQILFQNRYAIKALAPLSDKRRPRRSQACRLIGGRRRVSSLRGQVKNT